MSEKENQINGNIIKQVFLLILILIFAGLICWNLAMFIPSLLGALTLYIVSRKYNLYLQEKRGWKSYWAATLILLICLVVLVLPTYFFIDIIIERLGDSKEYMEKFNVFLQKIKSFIYNETRIDLLSKENIAKVQNFAAKFSTTALSGTFNTLTVIASMFFMLYFMLDKPRLFEKLLTSAVPLKKANVNLIGEKFRRLVLANAVGIPVVALGQGLVALIGYFIFDAPSPVLLFALTAVASVIPIVGGALIYVPVCIYMIAEGDTGGGIGLLLYCFIAVGITDNILRFTLLKRLENIHPLNTVFGIIMGMNLFGFMGLIFGPIMVSITLLLIQIYKDEFSENSPPPLELPDDEVEQKINLEL